ncbi:MAG: pentapeptide repeat-containing protein [Candidatus Wallbacteria bacterium]|nr:pentapeptide repeat-containing protein [Candidatus Wallbacteria bacterium]
MGADHDEFERQELLQLLRDGEIATFNVQRHQHSYKRLDLTRSDLIFAELAGVVFVEADLSDSNFSGANLTEANLKGAYISNADMSGSDLRRADLSSADLTCANMTGAVLASANLSGANLSDAHLAGVDFTSSNLRSADLRRADLRNAVLTHADLLAANLEGVQGTPEDYQRLGGTLEEGGDRAVKTGRFEEALQLYDTADRFFHQCPAVRLRVDLFHKLARLAQALGLSSEQVRDRGTNLLLSFVKSRAEAATAGNRQLEAELAQIHDALRHELGVPDEQPVVSPQVEVRELTRTDLLRHASVAARLYHRFDSDALLMRLGELIDAMDETTVLDLSVRFGIPDLQLTRAKETLSGDAAEFDRLRGESFLDVLKARLLPAISTENGAVHTAWKKGEAHALEPLIVILLKELNVPSPFRILAPLLAVLFVKTGLARYCSWVVQVGKLPIA